MSDSPKDPWVPGIPPSSVFASFGGHDLRDVFGAISQPGVAEAAGRSGEIRKALKAGGYRAASSLVIEAWRRQDWKTMGFPSMAEWAADAGLRSFPFPKEPVPDTRTVYFIQASESGRIKIGVAQDVAERMSLLQTGSPEPLNLVGMVPGLGHDGERALHERFAAARLHGEWFEPTAELLQYIRDNAGSNSE